MTDEQEPQDRTPPADVRRPVGEGPTVPMRLPSSPADDDESAAITPPEGERGARGEVTVRLTPSPADELTTVRLTPSRADDDEPTAEAEPVSPVTAPAGDVDDEPTVEAEWPRRPDPGAVAPAGGAAAPSTGGADLGESAGIAADLGGWPADGADLGESAEDAADLGESAGDGGGGSAGGGPDLGRRGGDGAAVGRSAGLEDGETVRLQVPAVVPVPQDQGTGLGAGSPDAVNTAEAAVTVSSGEGVPVPESGVDRVPTGVPGAIGGSVGEPGRATSGGGKPPPWKRLSSAGALIWVLLALFGFTLVVQLRSNNTDQGLATARQEDLVRILSDLEARDQRLQAEITTLEQSQRQLTSGVEGRQAALAEAGKRADELGLLAGTLPGRGPGLQVVIDPKGQVKASAILNAVQELRGAGGEVMQVNGTGGGAVRIVASTYFVDADGGGIVVDGARLAGPYTLWVIGSPQTMQTALQIPGGVVASVSGAGGSVTMEARSLVEVTAVRKAGTLQYAHPVS